LLIGNRFLNVGSGYGGVNRLLCNKIQYVDDMHLVLEDADVLAILTE
jgi:hypothetical protein